MQKIYTKPLVQYKILEGENFDEFSQLQKIHQNFLVQNFPF